MKRLFWVVMLAVIALTSCEKDNYHYNNELEPGYGLLSFAGADITVSEEVETRAVDVKDIFIWVYAVDENGNETVVKLDKSEGSSADYITYGAMPTEGIKLPAGNYKLVAQSATSVPESGNTPVYGAEKMFTIVAGRTTDLSKDENGNPTPIVCTLWQQVKVKVEYNEFFIQHLAGEGVATVKVSDAAKMSFTVKGNGNSTKPESIQDDPGYLKVPKDNGSAEDASDEVILQVEFEGLMKVKNDDDTYTNKKQKMRAAIPGVKAGQFRRIQFDMAEDKDGNANFTITIDGFVEDAPLTEDIGVTEESQGDDPNKPQGDGGIRLYWCEGSSDEVRNAWNNYDVENGGTVGTAKPSITVDSSLGGALKFEAEVPAGIGEFYVKITSDNDSFEEAVNGITLEGDGIIYLTKQSHQTVVEELVGLGIPFPTLDQVKGQTNVIFDLSSAISALGLFTGSTNTFSMNVTDLNGATNTINLVLVVPAGA